jgi:hypothetical protein
LRRCAANSTATGEASRSGGAASPATPTMARLPQVRPRLGDQQLAFRVRVQPRATATSPPRYAATPPESCHPLDHQPVKPTLRYFAEALPEVTAQQAVDNLPHRQHQPTQHHQRLAQLKGAALDLGAVGPFVKQQILQALQGLIQLLHGDEVPVDDDIQQPPQQEADAVAGQVGRAVPAGHHPLDVEPGILADGDQRPWGGEGGQLAGSQRAGVVIQADGVGGSGPGSGPAWAARAAGWRLRPPGDAARTPGR